MGRIDDRNRHWAAAAAFVVVATLVPIVVVGTPSASAAATVHQPGFALEAILGGYQASGPASIAFAPAPDTRVFVSERRGRVLVFDSIYDATPTTLYDIENQVHGFWDRGMLGMAIDPEWTTSPWIYLLYSLDTGASWPPLDGVGSQAPWGSSCPSPPGATDDGCTVDGELIRIEVSRSGTVTDVDTLVTGRWCSQYPSHAIGDLAFGDDGHLYVSAGEGASFTFVDYGQGGGDAETGNRTPNNPCGDPDPTPGGTNPPYQPNPALTLPDAEGGALRSQDLLTSGDPISYDGSILRIDKNTGAAAPGNPIATGPEARVIAHGLRNPYRITIQPGTNIVYAGDVGWSTWEEINVVPGPGGTLENFGWPCYEGNGAQPGYDGLDISLCEGLYADPGFGGRSTYTPPFYAYGHGSNKPDSTGCGGNGASISGIAFEQGDAYPNGYDDALFFGDFSYGCTWVMFANGGQPDTGNISTIVSDLGLVDLRSGPGDEMYLADFVGGSITEFFRLTYVAGNDVPNASITASVTIGVTPLIVDLDALGSTDPNGDHLTYAWDLDDDGQYDDGAGSAAQVTFASEGTFDVGLRVRDFHNAESFDTVTITAVGPNDPPNAVDDTYSVANNATLTVTTANDVLENDSDPNGDLTTARLIDPPDHHSGTFTLNADGTFTYDHDGSVTTQDTFTYEAFDGEDPSLPATVAITIDNDAPVLDPIGDKTVDEEALLAFTATATDPNGDSLVWALESGAGTFPAGAVIDPGDGSFTWTPTEAQGPGVYRAVVTVTDDGSPTLGDSEEIEITVNEVDLPPVVTIMNPVPSLTWAVGDAIAYGGAAVDPEYGPLPASAFDWTIVLHHCDEPGDCHIHSIETISGVTGGVTTTPDHEYPSFLEIILTATSGPHQVSGSVEVHPQAVDVTVASTPSGAALVLGGTAVAAPFTSTRIVGSVVLVSTEEIQTFGGDYYPFAGWSDGGERSHEITTPNQALTLTANFVSVIDLLTGVRDDLQVAVGSPPPGSSTEDIAALELARKKVKNALNSTLWTGASRLDPDLGVRIFNKLDAAVDALDSIPSTSSAHALAQNSIWRVVGTLDISAAIAITAAIDELAPQVDVDKAIERRALAAISIVAGKSTPATKRLRKAWRAATRYLRT